jgi:hypothetical protein
MMLIIKSVAGFFLAITNSLIRLMVVSQFENVDKKIVVDDPIHDAFMRQNRSCLVNLRDCLFSHKLCNRGEPQAQSCVTVQASVATMNNKSTSARAKKLIASQ